MAEDEQHGIAPLNFSGDPDLAFARLKRVVSQRNDAKLIEEHTGYLRYELRTTFFVDDAEFLFFGWASSSTSYTPSMAMLQSFSRKTGTPRIFSNSFFSISIWS